MHSQRCTVTASSVCRANDHCRCVAKNGIGSILALLCLVGNVKAEPAQRVIEGPARVIDGDTLEVSQNSQICMHNKVIDIQLPHKAECLLHL